MHEWKFACGPEAGWLLEMFLVGLDVSFLNLYDYGVPAV